MKIDDLNRFTLALGPLDCGMWPKAIEIYGVQAPVRIRQAKAPPLENCIASKHLRMLRCGELRSYMCVLGSREWVACHLDAMLASEHHSAQLCMYGRIVAVCVCMRCDTTTRTATTWTAAASSVCMRMENRSSFLHNASQRSLTAVKHFSVLPAFVCAIHEISRSLLKNRDIERDREEKKNQLKSGKPSEWRTQTGK